MDADRRCRARRLSYAPPSDARPRSLLSSAGGARDRGRCGSRAPRARRSERGEGSTSGTRRPSRWDARSQSCCPRYEHLWQLKHQCSLAQRRRRAPRSSLRENKLLRHRGTRRVSGHRREQIAALRPRNLGDHAGAPRACVFRPDRATPRRSPSRPGPSTQRLRDPQASGAVREIGDSSYPVSLCRAFSGAMSLIGEARRSLRQRAFLRPSPCIPW